MSETLESMAIDLDQRQLAEQLLAQAKEQGVELVGPNGLLNQLTKNVLETALDAEMAEHLGYDGAYSGRIRATFSANQECPPVQPTRWARTVAGIVGYCPSSTRTAISICAHADTVDGARSYRGGASALIALATVFRDSDSRLAIAACDRFSDRYSRRISAQSSTVITLQSEGCSLFDRNYLLTFQPEPTQYPNSEPSTYAPSVTPLQITLTPTITRKSQTASVTVGYTIEPATDNNIRAYVEQHSVDAPLAKLLTESPVLTSCDNEPAEARHDLALKLVNVPAELLSAEIRSQLVTSLGASQLEVDLLRRETGPLYSLLIAGNSIADDVTSWTHIASMSDWPTTELALKASKRFAEFASTALIPSDHLEALFGSLIVPHEIKVAMLRLLEEYGQVDTPALTAAARFALDQKGSPSPTLLVMFAKSRVPQNLIIELSVRRPVPLSQAELLNICEALGDPYAALVDPAIQTPSLPDNPDNRELIAILKKHFPSWRHTTLRKTSEVKLTKYPG